MPSHRNRGKTLWGTASRGKGVCPSCGRTSVKLLWDVAAGDGKTVKVCKHCRSGMKKKLA